MGKFYCFKLVVFRCQTITVIEERSKGRTPNQGNSGTVGVDEGSAVGESPCVDIGEIVGVKACPCCQLIALISLSFLKIKIATIAKIATAITTPIMMRKALDKNVDEDQKQEVPQDYQFRCKLPRWQPQKSLQTQSPGNSIFVYLKKR